MYDLCVFRGVPLWLRGRGVVFVLSGQNWRVRLDAPQRRHTRHQIHPEHRTELRPHRLQTGYKHDMASFTSGFHFYLWLCQCFGLFGPCLPAENWISHKEKLQFQVKEFPDACYPGSLLSDSDQHEFIFWSLTVWSKHSSSAPHVNVSMRKTLNPKILLMIWAAPYMAAGQRLVQKMKYHLKTP